MPRTSCFLHRFDRLQLRLLVVVLLAMAALGMADLESVREARWSAIHGAQDEAANLSRSMADQAGSVFSTLDTVLLGLRERVETDGLGAAALPRLQKVMSLREWPLPMLHRLMVLDAHGRVTAVSGTMPVPDTRFAQAVFNKHRDTVSREMLLGWPVRDPIDGAWVITISRRLSAANGAFSGVVLAAVAVDFFQTSFSRFDVGAHGVILLARDDAVLLARWPADASKIGADLSHGHLFSHIVEPGNRARFATQHDGRMRLASYYRLPGVPALVMVGRDQVDVLIAWREMAAGHLAAFLVIAVLVGFLGFRLARQIGVSLNAQRLLRASNGRLAASEARLAASNDWLTMSEQVSGVGHWFMSTTDSGCVTWSDEVYRIFGLNRSDFTPTLHGTPALYHPEDRDRISAAIANTMRTGTPTELEARVMRPDGQVRHIFGRSLPQMDDFGVPKGVFGVVMDITDRKRHEAALVEAHEATEAANIALEAANRALAALAMQDALTGLANRRHFDSALEDVFRRATRSNTSVALIMIDVDQFKQFNDTYGHPAGDACLRAIGAAILHLLNRPDDIAARYGGEEIAVLLPGLAEAEASDMAMRIADDIRRLNIPHEGSVHGMVTISAGVEAFTPAQGNGLATDLLQRADRALYAAKHAGRNRVYAFSQLEPRRRVA